MLLLLPIVSLFSLASAASPLISAYWPAWETDTQSPAQIPWSYTNIAYYFVTVTTASGFELPAGQSTSDIQSFVSSAHSSNSKAVFTVGGWTGSLFFSSLVATDSGRTSLATDLNAFLVKYNFDGVDIDWEYPNDQGIGCNNISSSDSANFLSFLTTLRSTLATGKLITAAVSPTGFVGSDGNALSDFSAYAKVLDYINIMAYDISGSWSTTTGPNAPLYTCQAATSGSAAVDIWTAGGFPVDQIFLGCPTYGHSFTTTSSTLTTTGGSQLYQAKTSVTPKGDANDVSATGTDVCGNSTTGFSGDWEYNTLISGGVLSSDGTTGAGGYTRYFDNCTQTPFLFNPTSMEFISYEDTESMTAKAKYAAAQGLAGIMLYDSTGFNTAILSAIQAALGSSSSSSSSTSSSASSSASDAATSASSSSGVKLAATGTTITSKPFASSTGTAALAQVTGTSTESDGDEVCDTETDEETSTSALQTAAATATKSPAIDTVATFTLASDTGDAAEVTSTEITSTAVTSTPTTPSFSVTFVGDGVTSTSISTSVTSTSTTTVSVAQGATLKCTSASSFEICDQYHVCVPMGSVADGTECVNDAIQMASSKKRSMTKKHKRDLALGKRLKQKKHSSTKRWF